MSSKEAIEIAVSPTVYSCLCAVYSLLVIAIVVTVAVYHNEKNKYRMMSMVGLGLFAAFRVALFGVLIYGWATATSITSKPPPSLAVAQIILLPLGYFCFYVSKLVFVLVWLYASRTTSKRVSQRFVLAGVLVSLALFVALAVSFGLCAVLLEGVDVISAPGWSVTTSATAAALAVLLVSAIVAVVFVLLAGGRLLCALRDVQRTGRRAAVATRRAYRLYSALAAACLFSFVARTVFRSLQLVDALHSWAVVYIALVEVLVTELLPSFAIVAIVVVQCREGKQSSNVSTLEEPLSTQVVPITDFTLEASASSRISFKSAC